MRFLKSRTESPGGLGVLGDVAHLFGKFTHKRARSSAQREMSRRVREGRPAFTAKTQRREEALDPIAPEMAALCFSHEILFAFASSWWLWFVQFGLGVQALALP